MHLTVRLSRSHRFWPHVAEWIPLGLHLVGGFVLVFLLAALFSRWFFLLAVVMALLVKGLFLGFLQLVLVKELWLELLFEEAALEVRSGASTIPVRVPWDQLKRIYQLRSLWVMSFRNGWVIPIPEAQMPLEVRIFLLEKQSFCSSLPNNYLRRSDSAEPELANPHNHSSLVALGGFLIIVLSATVSFFHDRQAVREARRFSATVVAVAPSTEPRYKNYFDVTLTYQDPKANRHTIHKRFDQAGMRNGMAVGHIVPLLYNENFTGEAYKIDDWRDPWSLTLVLFIVSGLSGGVLCFFLLVRKLNGLKLWG
ncbi:MAG: hypothetical protein K1Y36_17640 [Blastocatellia bacterium]|nr:hypothetical protein [Blastocatellia bacterium]